MQTLRTFIDKIIEFVCIAFVGIMTLLVTWQVITRYFFKSPSAITEQLSKYMFVWLVLLGAAYVFGKREHMSIEFMKDKFTGRLKFIVEIITELIILAFALGILVFGGFKNTLLTMTQQDSVLPLTIGAIYVMLPICGFITTIYSISNIIEAIKSFQKVKFLKQNVIKEIRS